MEAHKGTLGRRYIENEDVLIEDPFLNDFVKIINSKAYRRLNYKTQVFPLPENPHVRTRAVHTQEVIGLAVTIAEKLKLNRELCLAIVPDTISGIRLTAIGENPSSKISGNKKEKNLSCTKLTA